jgi:ATP-dependent Clp protease ATP-binding subunit ClpA
MKTFKEMYIEEAKKNQFFDAVKQYSKEEDVSMKDAFIAVLENGEYYFGEIFDYDKAENDEMKGIISEFDNIQKFTKELNSADDSQLKRDIKEVLAKI